MSYINPKVDFKDGTILYGSDLNASNEVIKKGVDDNFDRIKKLESGSGNYDKDIEELRTNKADKTELATKADKTELNAKADKIELETKANKSDLVDIAKDIDNLGTTKADKSELKPITIDIDNLQKDKLDKTAIAPINKEIEDLKTNKANKTDLDSKADRSDLTPINNAIKGLETSKASKTELANKADKTELDPIRNDMTALSLNKADKSEIPNLVEGTNIKLVKDGNKITISSTGGSLKLEIVDVLPTTGKTDIIYLVPKKATTNNVYDEYIYINNKFELIGSTEVDLTDYYNKTAIDGFIKTLEQSISNLDSKKANKDEVPTYTAGVGIEITPDNVINNTSQGGGTYELPPATTATLGGVIVGENLTVDKTGKVNATKYDDTKVKQDIANLESTKADKSALNSKADKTELTTKADKSELELKADKSSLTPINTDIANLKKDKADKTAIPTKVSQLENDKNYQNETQVQTKINTAIGDLTGFDYQVGPLPTTGKKGIIYLVPNSKGEQNIYDEYLWANNAFEKIGDTKTDLSNYYNKTETNNLVDSKVDDDSTSKSKTEAMSASATKVYVEEIKLQLEQFVKNRSSNIPVGTIIIYPSDSRVPSGWRICDGASVSRKKYKELFNKIGTSYGAGDGSTTFNLPNLKGRVPVGIDIKQTEFNKLGKTGGEKTHTLTIDEMPSHSHGDLYITGIPLTVNGSGSGNKYSANLDGYSVAGSNLYTSNTGGDKSHNNLQPYQVTCYIIKVFDETVTDGLIIDDPEIDSTANAFSAHATNVNIARVKEDLKPVLLYNNNKGSNDSITLSDNLINYNQIEIYYRNNGDTYNCTKAEYSPLKKVELQSTKIEPNNTWIITKVVELIDNKINNFRFSQSVISASGVSYDNDNQIYITKVLGYK